MKNNYRKLGDYIQPVDVRNSDLKVSHLLGLSIDKCFIESIANTIGTDFRPYKIVKKGQFAYGPVTSRNGEKITIALLEEPECIISSSYAVFEITDTSKLLPEYLMLWFSRPEFDRYARYKSHGSVREIFDWDEMCRVELPVPPLNEQQKIVDTYNAITNRIRIKQKINENLEKTAQCLFEELTKDKENFETKTIEEISDAVICGKTPSTTESKYWGNEIPFITIPDMHGSNFIHTTERYLSIAGKQSQEKQTLPKNSICVSCIATVGLVSLTTTESQTNQQINSIICKEGISFYYVFMLLKQMTDELKRLGAGGSTTLNVSKSLFASIKLQLPNEENMNFFDKKVSSLFSKILINEKEIEKLEALKMTVVSQISKR
ncbi:restriction endonuclease subunit S [Treponema porcinum]|uniref:restriction endonuclease subunit S n=1 Tax=Treponema porcinum TaxID=261392 RepID=UPI002A7F8AE4|nr:restriction endonuclease subunit S [Treponema porcinum]MDY4467343.1 restriction endonuclease subunit S [Treponema porcinum]